MSENMITRDEAIKKLKEYWETNQLVFQAKFHIPKNITLREGTKPFGYFINIRLNGEILEYPLDTIPTHERRVSIYQVLKDNLEDQEQYQVTLDLAKDEYRKKNPFLLVVKQYTKLENISAPIDTALPKTITDIFNENININSPFQVVNLANSVESLATDIYSEDKRFIYELIQNADDAALDEDSELSIQILKNYVIISHNGAPFNSRDIRGLCSIGLGTKTNDATKTGYKGIGFKSVFGQPDGLVYVKSEKTLFKFHREYSLKNSWNIKWGNKAEWEERNGVAFSCPWQMMPVLIDDVDDVDDVALAKVLNNERRTIKTAIKIVDSEQIFFNINRFFGDAKFLLFLRRITSVEIIYNNLTLSFKKEKKEDNKEIVSLIKNDELLSSWYVKTWIDNIPQEIQKELKSDPKTPKKIQSMEKTEISFALEINDTFDEIKLLKEGDSALYSYLPTTVKEYNMPFIVNCNFLLDASREKIHKNRKWNEWLFQVIGYKTVECCAEFLNNNLFETTYLSTFRNGFYEESDNLRKEINAGLKNGLEKFAILKNRKNELCKLNEVAIDRFDLYKVEPEFANKLATFINEKKAIKANEFLAGKNIIELNDANAPVLNLTPFVIDENHLQAFFGSSYAGQVITTASNYNILSFLYSLEINDVSGAWYTVITKNQLIINQYGELDYITRVCFPMELGESYDTEFKNVLIHNDVYQLIKNDTELVAWLVDKFGVTEPGSIAYLEKEIIGNIQNVITDTNYLDVTKFIYKLYTDKKLTEVHCVNLQELPLKTDKAFMKANICVLPQSYNPTIDFRSKLPEQAYLSEEYMQIANTFECRSFFKMLGVRDDIEFFKKTKLNSPELPPAYVEESNKFAKEGHTYPHLIGKFYPNTPESHVPYYLQTFTFLEQTNKFEFAKVFWNRIFDKYTLIKNRDAPSPLNYAPQRDYTAYNLGGGVEFLTIDEMAWGRMPSNTTYIPSYFIWYIQNAKCIPTNKGLELAHESFNNTETICELAGDFLPIIKIDKVVPEDWNKVLKLKTELSIDDLFVVLNAISDKVFLDKENEKRLGLIYNELMLKLRIDYENVSSKISNWAKDGRLISSAKKSIKAVDLLHIKIAGFENTNTGINTIFLPRNVDQTEHYFIDFLKALGVKIIDEFSYQSDPIREIFDLKIKLLKLVGPVCLLLKNKLIVNDMNKSMYDRFMKISEIQFFFCRNIHPIFTNESGVIQGEIVNFYYDKVEKKFLISEEWKNPLTLLEISYEICSLLSAIRLEKEIMMLLNLSVSDIEKYLTSQKLDLKEYQDSEIYKDIIKEIKNIEELEGHRSHLPLPINNEGDIDSNINGSDASAQNELEKVENETQSDAGVIDPFWQSLTKDDISFIRKVIGGEYEIDEKLEVNISAKIKTLMTIKSQYNESEIFDEGRFLKAGGDEILVRSAQKGLLYIDLYNWDKLNKHNVKIAVYTNSQISIYNSQADLFKFCQPQNKFGVLRMPNDCTLDDYNALDDIYEKNKWHFVFIVNENAKAVQNYEEVMKLDDYNFEE